MTRVAQPSGGAHWQASASTTVTFFQPLSATFLRACGWHWGGSDRFTRCAQLLLSCMLLTLPRPVALMRACVLGGGPTRMCSGATPSSTSTAASLAQKGAAADRRAAGGRLTPVHDGAFAAALSHLTCSHSDLHRSTT